MGTGMDGTLEELIDELSGLCGIIPQYLDAWGNPCTVSLEAKKGVLRAMGYGVESREGVRKAIARIRRKRYGRLLDPVEVVSVNAQPRRLRLYLPEAEAAEDGEIRWSVTDEEGFTESGSLRLGECPLRRLGGPDLEGTVEVTLPVGGDRPLGYYDVKVEVLLPGEVLSGRMRLVVAPDTAYLPPPLAAGGRTWGLGVNLYALSSRKDQGVGDLGTLGDLVRWVGGALGGDYVAVNPLHCTANRMPYGVSPYSPLSRLYSNMIYIDLHGVEDVGESSRARAIIESPAFRKELERLREDRLIDYEAVARLKRKVLHAAFQHFSEEHLRKKTERAERFSLFVSSEGKALDDHALFMALHELYSERGVHDWRDWPEEYSAPDSRAVEIFRRKQGDRILFHKYVQWLIDEQLAGASRKAEEAGMTIGIYRDLAVGSLAAGSDVWSNQSIFASGVDVGAPPDNFSLKGQNWGFPPLVPDRLREDGYEFFVQVIRKNLRHAGAIRIDHALGLFRLFWIPRGLEPREGLYVRYPYEDLLRIIALESRRSRTVVIAEDLGTIGEEVREALQRFGMLSCRLLYYERDRDSGDYSPPEAYPETAVASVTTHDLPTLSGFWVGRDIETKRLLNRYPDDEAFRRDLAARRADRQRLLEALGRAGVLPAGLPTDAVKVPAMTEELRLAVYRYLGKTPSKLLTVNLDDILGILDQQNLPGTVDEYPNWRQKVSSPLEELVKMDLFTRLAKVRGSPTGPAPQGARR